MDVSSPCIHSTT